MLLVEPSCFPSDVSQPGAGSETAQAARTSGPSLMSTSQNGSKPPLSVVHAVDGAAISGAERFLPAPGSASKSRVRLLCFMYGTSIASAVFHVHVRTSAIES